MSTANLKAILLIGPTGAGKTPLGDALQDEGLSGHRCFHFDFGAQLRSVSLGQGAAATLSPSQQALVNESLRSGRLLEKEQFPVAEAILRWFTQTCGITGADRIVLNGLPRHLSQAADVLRSVSIEIAMLLDCEAPVVLDRIRSNAGGDRLGRTDDSSAAVLARLQLFRERTVPLVSFFENKGIPVRHLAVTAESTGAEMLIKCRREYDAVFRQHGERGI